MKYLRDEQIIEMKLNIKCIEGKNFHNVWTKAIHNVIKNGTDLVIGGTEERKPIKDSCTLISLTGNAIKQIENRELHPQFPTKRLHLDKYCEEYTFNYLREYNKKSNKEKFTYLYYERLVNYFGLDQLAIMSGQLFAAKELDITSNMSLIITWMPELDSKLISAPCLQRIQIRYIPENKVDVHLTWRSRDLYAAWQSNLICLIDMLNREVIKINNCQIVRIIDFSDSLHIYKTDIEEAKKVKLVPVSPQEI